ncbi:MAG: right-handed parallel beta-helix repeat-containing protein [Draconibacterium sp.]
MSRRIEKLMVKSELKRNLIVLSVFIFVAFSARAETYYVSNSGNDSNPGTSTSLPWKTLEKVNGRTFSPGDQILFNRGDEWVGTISVTSRGSSGSPIVYGAYGTGAKPVITGGQKITGWEKHSGNIYKASVDRAVSQVFINGDEVPVSRHPNSGYLPIETISSNTVFSSSGLSGVNWKGATAILRLVAWSFEARKVVNASGNTITLENQPMYAYAMEKNDNFFVINHLNTLDGANQWAYDESSNTVYLWTSKGDTPDNYVVEVSESDNGFSGSGVKFVTIQDLDIKGFKKNGILFSSTCNDVVINNNTLVDNYECGIYISDREESQNIQITNNIISGSNRSGIRAMGNNFTVSSNTITNISLLNNIGLGAFVDAYNTATGMTLYPINNSTVSNNKVSDIGYNGIMFQGKNNMVEKNRIERACLTLQDGGGIYAHTDCTGTIIRNNIISDIGPVDEIETFGIYLDDTAEGIEIKENTIFGVNGRGIFLHNTLNVNVTKNILFENTRRQFLARHNRVDLPMENNVVTDNVFFAKTGHTRTMLLWINDGANLGVSTSRNYYGSPNKNNIATENLYGWGLTIEEYQQKSGMGEGAKYPNVTDYEKAELYYNDTNSDRTLNPGTGTFYDIDGKIVTKVVLKPFTSIILIKAEGSSLNQAPVINDQIFNVEDIKTSDIVAPVAASDPDAGQSLHYVILSGNQDNLFSIDPSTGEISANTDLSFSTNRTIVLVVQVTDNGLNPLSADAEITINIKATLVPDTEAPIVTSFSTSQTSSNLNVPVTSFVASDNVGVVGYLLSESPVPPLSTNNNWSTNPPGSYTFSGFGFKTLYAWAIDAAGNVSNFKKSTVTITDLSPVFTTEDISICEGESYLGWTTAGQYERTLKTSTGADSVVTTHLFFYPVYHITEDISIVEGESYQGWITSGTYTRNLSSVSGCDSIVTTHLSVFENIFTSEDVSICEGESYLGWTKAGQYERTLKTSTGADSTVITHLSVNPVYHITEDISIVEGESYQGWITSGTYTRNLSSVSGCDSIVTTILGVISVTPDDLSVTQEISLRRRWNIFSSYVIPDGRNMDSILKDLAADGALVKVVDEDGNTYGKASNGSWVNNIGDFSESKGYKIQVRSNCKLELFGPQVALPATLNLRRGWNIISFPSPEKVNAIDVVKSLIDAGVLLKVQDESGRSLENWGRRFGWVNRIGYFSPGEGYLVNVSQDCVLNIMDSYEKGAFVAVAEEALTHFVLDYPGNGHNHMNLYLDLLQTDFEAGDEIAAFDGNLCVGAVKLTKEDIENRSVSLVTSFSDVGESNGFMDGNPIQLKAWRVSGNNEKDLDAVAVAGDLVYEEWGSALIQISEELTGTDDVLLLDVNMYPNPATDNVTLSFSVLPEGETKVFFADMSGKILSVKEIRSTREEFDLRSLPSGIYMVRIVLGNSSKVVKLVKH